MSEVDRRRRTVERVSAAREAARNDLASGAQVAGAVHEVWDGEVSPEVGRHLHAVRDLAEASEVVALHCSIVAAREVTKAMRRCADEALEAAERELAAAERALYLPRGAVPA